MSSGGQHIPAIGSSEEPPAASRRRITIRSIGHYRFPPLINDSTVQTGIVMAFAKFGCLTVRELAGLLSFERSHVTKNLIRMRKVGISTSFRWGGNTFLRGDRCPAKRISREKLWALDPRYPLHRKVRALGRALAKGFAFPGRIDIAYRKFRRVRDLHPTPPEAQLHCLGDGLHGRMLMMLARRKLPITTLSKMLGCSRGISDSIESFRRYGVIARDEPRAVRRKTISLNRNFCAYFGLIFLAWAIDEATGREFVSLSLALRRNIGRKVLARINAKRAKRRAASKPYFLFHPLNKSMGSVREAANKPSLESDTARV